MQFKFSLRSLAIFITLASCLCAALVYAGIWTAGAALSLMLVALIWAVLAAIFSTGSNRSFGLGFAISGWLYALIAFSDLLGVNDQLLSTLALEAAGLKMPRATIYVDVGDSALPSSFLASTPDTNYVRRFVKIGQAAFTLLAGLLGGIAAQAMRARAERAKRLEHVDRP